MYLRFYLGDNDFSSAMRLAAQDIYHYLEMYEMSDSYSIYDRRRWDRLRRKLSNSDFTSEIIDRFERLTLLNQMRLGLQWSNHEIKSLEEEVKEYKSRRTYLKLSRFEVLDEFEPHFDGNHESVTIDLLTGHVYVQ